MAETAGGYVVEEATRGEIGAIKLEGGGGGPEMAKAPSEEGCTRRKFCGEEREYIEEERLGKFGKAIHHLFQIAARHC